MNKTITYKYDKGENLLLIKNLDYTIEEEITGGRTNHFTYASNGWKNQLIDFDGKSIL